MLMRHYTSKFRFNRQTKALADLCVIYCTPRQTKNSEILTATQETREVTWKHVEHYYDKGPGVYCELSHCYLLNAYGANDQYSSVISSPALFAYS